MGSTIITDIAYIVLIKCQILEHPSVPKITSDLFKVKTCLKSVINMEHLNHLSKKEEKDFIEKYINYLCNYKKLDDFLSYIKEKINKEYYEQIIKNKELFPRADLKFRFFFMFPIYLSSSQPSDSVSSQANSATNDLLNKKFFDGSKSIQDEIIDIDETLKRINIQINSLKKNANPKAMYLFQLNEACDFILANLDTLKSNRYRDFIVEKLKKDVGFYMTFFLVSIYYSSDIGRNSIKSFIGFCKNGKQLSENVQTATSDYNTELIDLYKTRRLKLKEMVINALNEYFHDLIKKSINDNEIVDIDNINEIYSIFLDFNATLNESDIEPFSQDEQALMTFVLLSHRLYE